jgi:hypothetical protein
VLRIRNSAKASGHHIAAAHRGDGDAVGVRDLAGELVSKGNRRAQFAQGNLCKTLELSDIPGNMGGGPAGGKIHAAYGENLVRCSYIDRRIGAKQRWHCRNPRAKAVTIDVAVAENRVECRCHERATARCKVLLAVDRRGAPQ